nr:hypothetical protein GCM10020093_089210 [Planobispora longispora]
MPAAPELAIGHSLGGLTLAVAVERLRPGRAIYSDPAFRLPVLDGVPMTDLFVQGKNATFEQIAAAHPDFPRRGRGRAGDAQGLGHRHRARAGPVLRPGLHPEPVVPSLVQLADPSFLVPPDFATELKEKGFEVRTVTGAEHTIHRHLYDDFTASIDDWL